MRSLSSTPESADYVAWLVQRGVSIDAITSPWSIQIRHVVFNNGAFTDCMIGEKAFIFTEADDEIAWDPVSGRIATRRGLAWGLGQHQLGTAGVGTTGRALPIRQTPLEWLQHHRVGAVIVDWNLAARVLARMTIEAANDLHADQLQRRLHLPGPTVVVRGAARRPELEPA